jgi:hypothetical protein
MSHVAVVDRVGTGVLSLFEFVGAIATFGGRAIVEAVRPPYEPREILGHLFQFGYRSAPLILTAGFAISKEHYGLHGTPEPGRIGYAQSHGCVRLTNWDAQRVAALVQPGTRVVFR